MTIYDFDTEVTVLAPTSGDHIAYSNSYDLTGGSDGVPSLFGGGPISLQFEVTTAFTKGSGDALAQFGIALSDTVTLDIDCHVLAMTGGSVLTKVGMDLGQLDATVRTFHLSIPPWEDILESEVAKWPDLTSSRAAGLAAFRLYRYMGIVCVNPMDVASANRWTAGAVKARVICGQPNQGTSRGSVLSNIYPSRMGVL